MKNISVSSKTLPCLLTVGLLISTSLPAIAQSQDSQSSQPEISSKGMVVAQQRPGPRNIRRSRLKFNVPNVRGSRNLEGGTARGPESNNCPQNANATALLPTTWIGLTTSTSPKFFVYLSQVSAPTAEFTLNDPETEETVYEETFSLPKTSGIVSFSLPGTANTTKLKAGKTYRWYFAVKCVPGESSLDVITGGNIQRVEAPSSLVQDLKKALPTEQPILYANEGMWFDALKSLADLRAANPNNLDLAADWKALLQESKLKPAELNSIAQAPVFPLTISNAAP